MSGIGGLGSSIGKGSDTLQYTLLEDGGGAKKAEPASPVDTSSSSKVSDLHKMFGGLGNSVDTLA